MSFVQNINGKFEKITEASWYKILMPKLYGWGAAVVILGALFKLSKLAICWAISNNWFNY